MNAIDALLTRTHESMRKKTAVVLVVSTALAYMPMGTALQFKELSEHELAGMRGKYVAPLSGSIQYFGLTMQTSWTTPVFSHQVESKVFVDASKGNVDIFVSESGSLGQKIESTSTATSATEFKEVNGAVQNIQVAGDDNSVHNQVSLNLVTEAEIGGDYGDAMQRLPVTRDELLGQPAQTSSAPSLQSTFQTEDGVTTYFNQSGNIGYTLVSGNNVITQQLNRGVTRQIFQSVVLQGNAHDVVNTMKLDVSFMNNPSLNQPRMMSHLGWFGL